MLRGWGHTNVEAHRLGAGLVWSARGDGPFSTPIFLAVMGESCVWRSAGMRGRGANSSGETADGFQVVVMSGIVVRAQCLVAS